MDRETNITTAQAEMNGVLSFSLLNRLDKTPESKIRMSDTGSIKNFNFQEILKWDSREQRHLISW